MAVPDDIEFARGVAAMRDREASAGRGRYLGVDAGLDYDSYDEDGGCTWCGGDGWDECDDPIQCLDPKCDGEIHPCTACAGTGLIEHQVIW